MRNNAVARTVVAVAKVPTVAGRVAVVDGGPASRHSAFEVDGELVAVAARIRTLDTPPNLHLVDGVVNLTVDRITVSAFFNTAFAFFAAHGVVEVVAGQLGVAVIDHADAILTSLIEGVLVGRVRHEGFPFTIEEHHGAEDVAIAGFRNRSRTTDEATNHPSVVEAVASGMFPSNTIERQEVGVEIADIFATRHRVGDVGRVEAQPQVLRSVDGHRRGQVDVMPGEVTRQEFARGADQSARSSGAALVHVDGVGAAVSPAVVTVDVHEVTHGSQSLAIIGSKLSGSESDTPVHSAAASTDTTREGLGAVLQIIAVSVLRLNGQTVGGVRANLFSHVGAEFSVGENDRLYVLGTAAQLDVVDVQDELVGAAEVTHGNPDVLTGVGAQVSGELIPVTFAAGSAVATDDALTSALGRDGPFGDGGEVTGVGVAARRDGEAEVLARIAHVLRAGPHADGAAVADGVLLRSDNIVIRVQSEPCRIAVALAHEVTSAAVRSDSRRRVVAGFGARIPVVAVVIVVDEGPAVQAVVPALGEAVAAALAAATAATGGIIPSDSGTFNFDTVERASVVGAALIFPFGFNPVAHARAIDGSDLADVVLAFDEFVGGHLAERMYGVGVEDRFAVDGGAHHLEVFEVTLAVLGAVGQLNIVHVQD